jgi:predicted RNase H-like nuclease (RuvC/YqgF family)
MKKYLFLLFIPALFACTDIKEDPEYKKMLAERDSLSGLANTDATEINKYLSDFNDIQENLNKIKEKENLITVQTSGGGELSQDSKDQINNDIQLIYDLMIKNKQTIESLKHKMKKSNAKIVELEKMLANMQKQLDEKDAELASLRDQLAKLNIEVAELKYNIDSLNAETAAKDNTISDQTNELNTAFYVFGTKRELMDHQIITKEGGFIGIGKIEKLMDNFNKDYFTKIDITQVTEITLAAKKAKILTTHPASSYRIEGEKKADKLVITNPKEFWGASKYLVIVVE